MAKQDRRKRGCLNINCEGAKRKEFFTKNFNYCPYCGIELSLVCADCYKEIEDLTYDIRLCDECKQVREVKKQTRKNDAKKVIKPIVQVATVAVNKKNIKKAADIAIKVVKKNEEVTL